VRQKVLVVELSTGQMVGRRSPGFNGKVPVDFHGRSGGNVPSVEEIHADLLALLASVVHSEPQGQFTSRR